jgi:uncharacterized protein YycO
MRTKTFALILFLVSNSLLSSRYLLADWAQNPISPPRNLQKGDLIFVSLNCFACKLIQQTSHSNYSHVAIIQEDAVTHALSAVMAVPPKVIEIQGLNYFYDNSLIPPLIMRMRTVQTQTLARLAADMARNYIGRPYDSDFESGPRKLYCSSLLSNSFKDAAKNISDSMKDPLPFIPMDFSIYKAEWAKILGHPPPQGKLGISPGDIERSPLLVPVTERN